MNWMRNAERSNSGFRVSRRSKRRANGVHCRPDVREAGPRGLTAGKRQLCPAVDSEEHSVGGRVDFQWIREEAQWWERERERGDDGCSVVRWWRRAFWSMERTFLKFSYAQKASQERVGGGRINWDGVQRIPWSWPMGMGRVIGEHFIYFPTSICTL